AYPNLWIDYFLNGFVFYGGVIGGFLFALWYCKKYHIYFLEACDLFAPILPFFHIFGRIGCFLAGCCYGIPASWGFMYPHETFTRLPLPLIEAVCNLVILTTLLLFEKYCSPRGYHLPFYGILYGITRFVLEFFRGDSARGVWLLSTSQWISIAVVLGSVIWTIWNAKRLEKLKQYYLHISISD
ncbi:MAG: prolipoprotein diacylglyceryl transferase, partial [Acutalibacteraceae bacterium]|nr:prolipoprotein diacylglyceryl transferase [Acutalibacteraceae bacterium]